MATETQKIIIMKIKNKLKCKMFKVVTGDIINVRTGPGQCLCCFIIPHLIAEYQT